MWYKDYRQKKRVRFQDRCETNLSSKSTHHCDSREDTRGRRNPEVFTITEIPEEQVELEKGYY